MVKNPYGLRNNDPRDWVSVYEVDKADSHEYFCGDCRGKLIAVQPSDPKRQWFFRHELSINCEGSRESAIHQMAKQILVEERKIMLPYLPVKPEPAIYQKYKFHKAIKPYRLVDRRLCHFDMVNDEVRENGRTPDIVAVLKDHKLFIEIVVTHDIDEDKLRWIREQNISTLKVLLGGLPYDATKDRVRQCLMNGRLNGVTILQWVHHAKMQEHQARANEFYIQQVERMGLCPASDAKLKASSPMEPRVPRQGTLFS